MIWRLTWPETLAALAVGLLIGWASTRVFRTAGLRRFWATACALAFVGCSLLGIVFDIDPQLAHPATRIFLQAGAVAVLVTGLTYAAQDT